MKIIYIANARIPTEKAHGLQIMKMCETFALAGVDLELILPSRLNTEEFKKIDPFVHYKIKKNFRITIIKVIDPIFLINWPAGIYIKFQSFFFSLGLFFYLLFKKDKKNCIFYTRDEYLLPIIQFFSKQVIWECHVLSRTSNFYSKFIRNLFYLIVLTKKLKDNLIEFDIDEKKILVSPDAVDLDVFDLDISQNEARRKLNLPNNKIILGYTGSFKTKGMDKGLTDILKALKIIISKRQDVIFVAIGGNTEDIKYYQLVAKNEGVLSSVIFLPPVSQNQLAIYQKSFNLLLMPFPHNRHYAYFMSPLKMFEYMAAKKPIITSNLPSIREILDDNDAFFIEPDNPISLANGTIFCLNNRDFCDKISQRAFIKVKNYTWQQRAQKIIDFISK